MEYEKCKINIERYEVERLRKGLKNKDVARAIGISENMLVRLKKNNNKTINIVHLLRLGELLGVNWKYLCGISEDRIVQELRWYSPEEKLPPEGLLVVATISGKANNSTYDHALVICEWYDDGLGWSLSDIELDEFVVHAWCDLKPYGMEMEI